MAEPKWVAEARKYLGQREVPGPASSNWIRAMWAGLKGGLWYWKQYGEDDSRLPWCGGFMAYVMDRCGIAYPSAYASAKAWLQWGTPLAGPCVGAVVVFTREGGGHVGLVLGRDSRGRLLVLGGNQGDAVSVAPFDLARVSGYVFPPGFTPEAQGFLSMPVLAAGAASSTNEA